VVWWHGAAFRGSQQVLHAFYPVKTELCLARTKPKAIV
jgi:hypothetical protein